jgi:hypothetical protein
MLQQLLQKQFVSEAQGGHSVRNDAMLTYFLSTLTVRATWLQSQTAPDSAESQNIEEIKKRIVELRESNAASRDNAWTEAYSLERMLSLVEPTGTLLAEIRRRLDEADSEYVKAAPQLRAAFLSTEAQAVDKTKTPPEIRPSEVAALRSFLLDIFEEIHWTNQRKYHARPIYKKATSKVVIIGLISFCLFLLPYLIIYIGGAYTSGAEVVERWTWLPLYTALTGGLFGATFSRLMFMQSNGSLMSLEELNSAGQMSSILLRASVGMCGALIVFFFLQSGIVQGNLFPNFQQLGLTERLVPTMEASNDKTKVAALRSILPSPALALLFVWCFLAGFSERLVPSILSSTEQSLGEAARGIKK